VGSLPLPSGVKEFIRSRWVVTPRIQASSNTYPVMGSSMDRHHDPLLAQQEQYDPGQNAPANNIADIVPNDPTPDAIPLGDRATQQQNHQPDSAEKTMRIPATSGGRDARRCQDANTYRRHASVRTHTAMETRRLRHHAETAAGARHRQRSSQPLAIRFVVLSHGWRA